MMKLQQATEVQRKYIATMARAYRHSMARKSTVEALKAQRDAEGFIAGVLSCGLPFAAHELSAQWDRESNA